MYMNINGNCESMLYLIGALESRSLLSECRFHLTHAKTAAADSASLPCLLDLLLSQEMFGNSTICAFYFFLVKIIGLHDTVIIPELLSRIHFSVSFS